MYAPGIRRFALISLTASLMADVPLGKGKSGRVRVKPRDATRTLKLKIFDALQLLPVGQLLREVVGQGIGQKQADSDLNQSHC